MRRVALLLALLSACSLGARCDTAAANAYCMSGVRCGDFCAPLNGRCINGDCYDISGMRVMCYAPMAAEYNAAGAGGAWWSPLFPPFLSWRPIMPLMAPMPPINGCSGGGPCDPNEFCDPTGSCRSDDCLSQFKYGCPADTSDLVKVACPHFSGFTRCYASTSGGFTCNKGPSGTTVACASQGGGSSYTTVSRSYQAPNGAGVSTGGFVSSSSGYTTQPATTGAAAVGPVAANGASTVTVVQQPPVGQQATSTTAGSTVGSTATGSTTPNAGAGAGASSSTKRSSTTSGPTQSPPEIPVTESATGAAANAATAAPPSATAPPGGSTAGSAPAATTTKAASGSNVPAFIVEGPGQQTVISPDGSTATTVGSGPPGIAMTNIAPDGSSLASGSATGDHQSVTTTTLPGGSSVTSTSYSAGPSSGPVSASASSTGSAQPLYTPFQTGQGNAAAAAFMGSHPSAPGSGSSSSDAAGPARAAAVSNSAGGLAVTGYGLLASIAAALLVGLWMC